MSAREPGSTRGFARHVVAIAAPLAAVASTVAAQGTSRVSLATGGAQGNDHSYAPALSADGRCVAFASSASTLVVGDTNVRTDVFVHDRATGILERVSVDSAGAQGNGPSDIAAISADGRYVAFRSGSSDLAAGDTNGESDSFVRDRLTGTTVRASVSSGGVQGNAASNHLALSANGRYVVFVSNASNLVAGDTNGVRDVFVRDVLLGTTVRVSVGPGGSQGNDLSTDPSISADGRWVGFRSYASDLVVGDTNGASDVFVHDRQTGTTERVSVDPGGAQSDGYCSTPSISADGRYVAFDSFATNLVIGDTNGRDDIFVRERRPSFTPYCSGDRLDTSHTTPCPCGNVGAAGHGCASSAQPSGALLTASGSTYTDTVQLAGSAMPASSTCIYLQGDALDDATFGDGVRCTGGGLVRLRTRTNVGGSSAFPDSTDSITLSARSGVAPFTGLRRFYQTYYRNAAVAFCPPETFNVTNGIVIDW